MSQSNENSVNFIIGEDKNGTSSSLVKHWTLKWKILALSQELR